MTNTSRRNFIKNTATASIALASPLSAKSYSNILGANDRVNFAVAGLNGRGNAHISAVSNLTQKGRIVALCDVDSRTFAKVRKSHGEKIDKSVKDYEDIRILLENKDIDALTVATPDHWHAPMGIMAMQAGKHVYLEKPCCHNPKEGELLIAAQQATGKKLQIGNQQRSARTSISVIKQIKEGIIGNANYGKAWYANTRGSIGTGKKAPIPEWLNWDLWQGPAPRTTYKDNYVHYKWHWFWQWGTGEINNNGLHELDICRWALGVNIPTSVTSSGGRFNYQDDWEFYDTQVSSFHFEENKMITWEGRSCNGFPFNKRGRGASIHGDKGTVILDREGYEVYDKAGKLIKEEKEKGENAAASTDTLGIGNLDNYHMDNFINAIQKDEALRSDVHEGVKSNLLCHLGNIAQKSGLSLDIDPKTGKPKNEESLKSMWSRSYEKGWEPKV